MEYPGIEDSNSSSFDDFKGSLLIILLVLLITFLITLSIHFLLRYRREIHVFLLRFLSREIHPAAPSSSSSTAVAVVSSSDSPRVSPIIQQPSSSVLDSLPIFRFSSVNRRGSNSSNSGDCAVCLSTFEPDDQLRLLPLCCHAFHVECIDIWLSSNQTCPLCRSPLTVSESELMRSLVSRDNSFRLEIGSISRRRQIPIPEADDHQHLSYSIGSFDYIVDDFESEISVYLCGGFSDQLESTNSLVV